MSRTTWGGAPFGRTGAYAVAYATVVLVIGALAFGRRDFS